MTGLDIGAEIMARLQWLIVIIAGAGIVAACLGHLLKPTKGTSRDD